MEKGYKETSLRQLCKQLGFIMGAFYGYFNGKEELFDAIVSQPAEERFQYYVNYHNDYMAKDSATQYEHVGDVSTIALDTMLNYMYQHYAEFKLLFCRSIGTKYESYMERFISVEVDSTNQFLSSMENNGFFSADIDEQLSHNLAIMLFKGIIEIFEHDIWVMIRQKSLFTSYVSFIQRAG